MTDALKLHSKTTSAFGLKTYSQIYLSWCRRMKYNQGTIWYSCFVHADSKVGAVWGVVAAVAGPTAVALSWFVLTWYYRSEKKIITEEVIRRLKGSDICKVESAVQYAPAAVRKQAKRINVFRPAELEMSPSLVADMIRSGSFTSAVSATSETVEASEALSPEMRRVARQITKRCLRRWDGLLGIRASSDSLGNRAGIWRDRFDTVRCAVLLLAFRKLNQALQADPASFRGDCPGMSSSTHAVKYAIPFSTE